MNVIKIEVNGLDITNLIEKLDKLIQLLDKDKAEDDAPEKFLTRGEVAELLKITLPTLHDWTKKGLLKAYKISNRIRYKEKEVMKIITKNQVKH